MVWQALKGIGGPVAATIGGGVASAVGAANALPILGFGVAGIEAGSIAAGIQSTAFATAVPAGGWFATATSLGMTGAATVPLVAVAGPIGAVSAAAVCIYFKA